MINGISTKQQSLGAFMGCLAMLLASQYVYATHIVIREASKSGEQCSDEFSSGFSYYPASRMMRPNSIPSFGYGGIVDAKKLEIYRERHVISEQEIKIRSAASQGSENNDVVKLAEFNDDQESAESYRVSIKMYASGKIKFFKESKSSKKVTLPVQKMYPSAPISRKYPNAVEFGGFAPEQGANHVASAIDMMLSAIHFLSTNFHKNLSGDAVILLEAVSDANPSLISLWEKMGFVVDQDIRLKPGRVLMYMETRKAYRQYIGVIDEIIFQEIDPAGAVSMIRKSLKDLDPLVARYNYFLQYYLAYYQWRIGAKGEMEQILRNLNAIPEHDPERLYLEALARFSKHIDLTSMRGSTPDALAEIDSMRREGRFTRASLPDFVEFDVLEYLTEIAKLVSDDSSVYKTVKIPDRILPQFFYQTFVAPNEHRHPFQEGEGSYSLSEAIFNGQGLSPDIYKRLAIHFRKILAHDYGDRMQELADRLK